MSRSSGRAQTDPLAALVAVAAVVAGLSTYAGILETSLAAPGEPADAGVTLDAIHDAVARDGIVRPSRFAESSFPTPRGGQVNATLWTAARAWQAGPPVPNGTHRAAATRVTVRLAPGRVSPGRLEVVVW